MYFLTSSRLTADLRWQHRDNEQDSYKQLDY